ncbi:MAG: hypothetical protein IT429_22930 [Gemmataceae bacterium]|nr:hypothetical protein [Gemmataceae bacterium]
MTDYQIQPNTRRCAVTGRELRPGEKVYTALVEEGGKFLRQDYSAEAWQGTPPGAFSFWCGRVPAQEEAKKPRIDDDLLFDCFQRLAGQADPNRVNFRYVVALLLMRRKRLRFDEARKDGGREALCLRCTRTGAKYEVRNPALTEEQMTSVQEEVFKVLGWD